IGNSSDISRAHSLFTAPKKFPKKAISSLVSFLLPKKRKTLSEFHYYNFRKPPQMVKAISILLQNHCETSICECPLLKPIMDFHFSFSRDYT
ncbi:hypothetical protein CEXT_668941, partial [Caerostris extrusa]